MSDDMDKIDWAAAPEWAQWSAKDADGSIWIYEVEPDAHDFVFNSKGKRAYKGQGVPDVFNWRESLRPRPVAKPATESPKLWCDMTPEEKGALWVKVYSGGVVEWSRDAIEWDKDPNFTPDFNDDLYYRIRTEPKREMLTLYWGVENRTACLSPNADDTHRITLPLIDSSIPPGTYTSPEGNTITVDRTPWIVLNDRR
jgi:hypothetical protein